MHLSAKRNVLKLVKASPWNLNLIVSILLLCMYTSVWRLFKKWLVDGGDAQCLMSCLYRRQLIFMRRRSRIQSSWIRMKIGWLAIWQRNHSTTKKLEITFGNEINSLSADGPEDTPWSLESPVDSWCKNCLTKRGHSKEITVSFVRRRLPLSQLTSFGCCPKAIKFLYVLYTVCVFSSRYVPLTKAWHGCT